MKGERRSGEGGCTAVGVPVVVILRSFLFAHELLVDDFFELDHLELALGDKEDVVVYWCCGVFDSDVRDGIVAQEVSGG